MGNDSAILISQITKRNTNQVESYEYSIINDINSNNLYEQTLSFDPAREICEAFLWENFSGKPILYKEYEQSGDLV